MSSVGLSVDTVFKAGWTSLMYAASCAHEETLTLLLENGADPNFHKGSLKHAFHMPYPTLWATFLALPLHIFKLFLAFKILLHCVAGMKTGIAIFVDRSNTVL